MRTSVRLAVSMCVVACGGDPTPRPIAPLAAASADASPSPLADSTDASVADVAPPDAAPSGHPRRADVIDSYDESLLFADETRRLQEVARELIAAQHLPSVDVLSRDEHAELEAVRASGRLRKGGPVCGRPPSKMRTLNANVGGLGIVVRFVCSDTAACDVRAELVDGVGPPDKLAYLPHLDDWIPMVRAKADVASGGDVVAIERVLRAAPVEAFSWAQRATPARPRSLVRPGHRAMTVRIAGGWSVTPKESDVAGAQAAIDACPGREQLPENVVIAVGASGAVTRCEPYDGSDNPLGTCACVALAKLSFGVGGGNRRLLLEVGRVSAKGARPPPSSLTATPGARAKVEISAAVADPPLPEDWELGDAVASAGQSLGACFKPLSARRDDDVTVAAELDEGGLVTSATLSDAAWMTDAQRACAQGAILAMRLQCPVVEAERHLTIGVSVGR